MENLILLDSTWVDLYSEHIIWYALVQIFCYEGFVFSFLFILAKFMKNYSKLQKNQKIENQFF